MWATSECSTTSQLKPASTWIIAPCDLGCDLTLKEACYFLLLDIKLTCWLLPSLTGSIWSLIQVCLKTFSLCLQLFVVTVWAWNSYFSKHIKSTGVSNSSSPFSAEKALQNHLTHWRSNYLPVYWRCEGKFPKWHTILWMFLP